MTDPTLSTNTAAAQRNPTIVALDLPTEAEALEMVRQLRGAVSYFKIGLELFTSTGPAMIEKVRKAGGPSTKIFLDLKYHDIPNQVARSVSVAARLGVDMLTVHLSGGLAMLEAAAKAVRGSDTLILGVTVLTSSTEETLLQIGVPSEIGDESPVKTQVLRLARLAVRAGIGGLVASPLELVALRADPEVGKKVRIVTPGVRPTWASGGDDQRRVMTPKEAIVAGADYLVIGRPITSQSDPAKAALRIVEELE